MRTFAPAALTVLLVMGGCALARHDGGGDAAEGHPGESGLAFTSREALLADFAFDGRVITTTDDPGAVRNLIEAQLMYAIGHLNNERSVGHNERLELTDIRVTRRAQPKPVPAPPPPPPPADDAGADPPDGGVVPPPPPPPPPVPEFDVAYHARLPVAWGGGARGGEPVPARYGFTLPARVAEEDQERFAALYADACAAPEGGYVSAPRFFLYYRPQRGGCELGAGDVVRFEATVSPSALNTKGKYPEYDRVWEDGALRVVVMFSHELSPTSALPPSEDEGVLAYDEFVRRASAYLADLQPDPGSRALPALSGSPAATMPVTTLSATLPDGRVIRVDARLVAYRLRDDGAAFDAWYDALTREADAILYNGHAGLGVNVRTLTPKGTFVPGKYLIWYVNGCDTFAYVDRTLTERRAALNPDDPTGTKYMDTVSNVLSGYFSTNAHTAMMFVDALALARTPAYGRTYEDIFVSLDPSQITVVTGEEDNEFVPHTASVAPEVSEIDGEEPGAESLPEGDQGRAVSTSTPRGCSAAPPGNLGATGTGAALAAALLGASRLVGRRRPRGAQG